MTVDTARLPTLKLGSTGKAVTAAKMGVNHWNAKKANTTPVFGVFFRTLVKQFQTTMGIPATGVIGPATWTKLLPYIPAAGLALLPQKQPKPVEPLLPVASLHPSLWAAYSDALTTKGLFSLGTYNPASRLPSGAPSDHAVYPAYAFDIGFDPDTGWANPVARAYAERTAKRLEVEYVILGDRIHINGAWKTYTGGGHLNHIHVSGRR